MEAFEEIIVNSEKLVTLQIIWEKLLKPYPSARAQ